MNSPKDLKIEFGKNIRHIRKSKGYNQKEFANMICISVQTLSGIENGTNFPSCALLYRMIKALEINPYKLFIFDRTDLSIDDIELTKILVEKFKNTTYSQRKLIFALVDTVINNSGT